MEKEFQAAQIYVNGALSIANYCGSMCAVLLSKNRVGFQLSFALG